MNKDESISLLGYNTFGIDVKAKCFIEYDSVEELVEILRTELPFYNRCFHIGGGSNLLFVNDFDGLILHSRINNIELLEENATSVRVRVGAGVIWDDFVAHAVSEGWYGIENLSLIPGEVGASAVQNVGAYGVEAKDVILRVHTLELSSLQTKVFENEDCKYGYRQSIFKSSFKGQYIINAVEFQLSKLGQFHLEYQNLETEVMKNGLPTLQNVRNTVIHIRESKLPDPKLNGNAGSFFMNPVVDKELFLNIQSQYPAMPHYYVSETEEKIPAGWLIEQCGWKGKQVGNVAVHDKQALVIVNKGGATGNEVVQLAIAIQQSVFDAFGVSLVPEVIYV
jgi:UDP-N-acetylmuramate dehydrogenase